MLKLQYQCKRNVKMKIIDLTHDITEDMPVYPNSDKPKLKTIFTYEKDGFRETMLTLGTHIGTHIDSPAHIIEGKPTLDTFPVSQFVGKALVIDCRSLKDGEEITADHILTCGEKLNQAEFLLFNLGWDKKWGTNDYFGDFPCLSSEAINVIVNGNYKGVGFDVISIDGVGKPLRVHTELFTKKSLIVVENLKDLDLCGSDLFTFVCLPLKLVDVDGSPARAIAIIEE